VVTNIAN